MGNKICISNFVPVTIIFFSIIRLLNFNYKTHAAKERRSQISIHWRMLYYWLAPDVFTFQPARLTDDQVLSALSVTWNLFILITTSHRHNRTTNRSNKRAWLVQLPYKIFRILFLTTHLCSFFCNRSACFVNWANCVTQFSFSNWSPELVNQRPNITISFNWKQFFVLFVSTRKKMWYLNSSVNILSHESRKNFNKQCTQYKQNKANGSTQDLHYSMLQQHWGNAKPTIRLWVQYKVGCI